MQCCCFCRLPRLAFPAELVTELQSPIQKINAIDPVFLCKTGLSRSYVISAGLLSRNVIMTLKPQNVPKAGSN